MLRGRGKMNKRIDYPQKTKISEFKPANLILVNIPFESSEGSGVHAQPSLHSLHCMYT